MFSILRVSFNQNLRVTLLGISNLRYSNFVHYPTGVVRLDLLMRWHPSYHPLLLPAVARGRLRGPRPRRLRGCGARQPRCRSSNIHRRSNCRAPCRRSRRRNPQVCHFRPQASD